MTSGPTLPFRPHGDMVAHLDGRILYFDATGPFNGEMVEAVIRAYQPLLQRLADGGPYAHISVFHRSMLITPDALEAFDRLLAEWRRSGLAPVANAYVAATDVEGRNLMMGVFSEVFERFSRFRAFHELAAAEAWIRAELAGPG